MCRELCFRVENENIYLEKILVDYENIPIFFLCKGNKSYYVVLCTDIDNFNYVMARVSAAEVYNLLHGNVSMRNLFLNQKEYWEVLSGRNVLQDIVTKRSIESLDVSLLPKEDAYFDALTESLTQKF